MPAIQQDAETVETGALSNDEAAEALLHQFMKDSPPEEAEDSVKKEKKEKTKDAEDESDSEDNDSGEDLDEESEEEEGEGDEDRNYF
jgi:hypothetical protein